MRILLQREGSRFATAGVRLGDKGVRGWWMGRTLGLASPSFNDGPDFGSSDCQQWWL